MIPAMIPDQLRAALDEVEVHAQAERVELVKNVVGNLSIVVGGAYVGWIDLRTGEVEWKSWP